MDYAIHDTTLEDIANTIRKKDGTSALIDPADYADRINLMGMLPEKSASGAIAHFEDGADDVPTKSLVVTIPPTLDGKSEVTETQTGKNLLENTLTTQTVNGTTFTVNADKSITISGTPSATTRVYISTQNINVFSAMFFSFGNMPTGTRVFCSRTSGGSTTYPTISPSHTATLNADYTNFLLEVTTSFDGTSFSIYPMLEFGSTAHAYEQYQTPTVYTASLGRTIYGGTVDLVNGTGTDGYTRINMTDLSWDYDNTTYAYGYFYTSNVSGKATNKNFVCNLFTNNGNIRGALNDGEIGVYNNTTGIRRFCVRIDSITTVTAFEEYIASGKITYELETPSDFTFTPISVNSRYGVNNLWTDNGSDNQVSYRADIGLALI